MIHPGGRSPVSGKRMSPDLPLRGGPYPLRVRPGGVGSTSLEHWEWCECSISASKMTTGNEDFYGSPVPFSKLPDLATLEGYIGVTSSPISANVSMDYDGAPISGLSAYGSGQWGMVLYVNGNKIDFDMFGGGTYWVLLGNQSSQGRFLPYGYYSSRYNAGMDGNSLIRGDSTQFYSVATQSWGDPPYKPTHLGLWCRLNRCSISISTRILFRWTTT